MYDRGVRCLINRPSACWCINCFQIYVVNSIICNKILCSCHLSLCEFHVIYVHEYGLKYKTMRKKVSYLNTLRPRQDGRHFADDIFKRIFLNKNVCISIEISLKFVPKGPNHNMPALVQIMAWRRPGDKPLHEPMIVRLPTHICVTRPRWVKCCNIHTTAVAIGIC